MISFLRNNQPIIVEDDVDGEGGLKLLVANKVDARLNGVPTPLAELEPVAFILDTNPACLMTARAQRQGVYVGTGRTVDADATGSLSRPDWPMTSATTCQPAYTFDACTIRIAGKELGLWTH